MNCGSSGVLCVLTILPVRGGQKNFGRAGEKLGNVDCQTRREPQGREDEGLQSRSMMLRKVDGFVEE